MTATPKPFRIHVSDEKLNWINDRVRTSTVIPDVPHDKGKEWDDGVPSSVMQEYVDFWRETYDWRAEEARINSTFEMFTVPIEEGGETIDLHFVHHRSASPSAVPLLFAHGWPGSFLEVESLLKLTASEGDFPGFHIIAPSLPGFAFSSSPQSSEFSLGSIASIYHKLMKTLGYDHYLLQGGDWGSLITRIMAMDHPDACVGIHINFLIAGIPSPLREPLTTMRFAAGYFRDTLRLKLGLKWLNGSESGFSKIQATKPQTISQVLADSPVGMLAWIFDKLHALSDPAYEWDKARVITWTTTYLLTESSAHARIYKYARRKMDKEVSSRIIPAEVALGASAFAHDPGYAPQWLVSARIGKNVVFYNDTHKVGGHFPSVEVPDLFIADLKSFVGRVRNGDRWKLLEGKLN
ncbi:Alpha/Beta hydrolase protein [Schizophyllum amplum]|uniref:Alpha/Beta hydrolase protein n=1 Tax=Schizophyllum amplum TaxID=97359 RepID=A0A550CXA1_9AGAR|nr:Alpha/Beta hydrolase protein [Auriculariopsis ampla]